MLATAHLSFSLTVMLVASATVLAQTQDHASPPTEASARELGGVGGNLVERAQGISRVDGVLLGVGPAYRARFEEDQVVFWPALGANAPRSESLALRTLSVGRDDAMVPVPAADRVEVESDRVRYPRDDFVEIYETRAAGIEQSFVFDRAPTGRGDLVVRVGVTTRLPLLTASRTNVRFGTDALGGVRVSTVVGIDADDRRVAGTIRYADGVLELRLPAEFVESARWPVVLDPLIGPVQGVASGPGERYPDVAYDATHDVYLVVWQITFSLFDTDVIGQRVDATTGAPVGNALVIRDTTFVPSLAPKVANVALRDTFVVVWNESSDVMARGVHAGTGALSQTVTVAGGLDVQRFPDVGGEMTDSDEAAVAVWANFNLATVRAARVKVDATGALAVSASVHVSSTWQSGLVLSLAISRTGGTTGRYGIAWTEVSPFSAYQVSHYVIDRNLGFVSGGGRGAGSEVGAIDIDGDGRMFVYAWEQRGPSGDLDIWAGTTWVVGVGSTIGWGELPTVVEGDPFDEERAPSVAVLGSSALIGYADQVSGSIYDPYVQSVEPYSHRPCEGEFLVLSGRGDLSSTAIAYKPGTGSLGERALMVWDDAAATSTAIQSVQFQAADGVVQDLGGGCTARSAIGALCPRVGGATMRLVGVPTPRSTDTMFVLSARRIDAVCGACVLVPDPFAGVVVQTIYGRPYVDLSLPSAQALRGASFYVQHLDPTQQSCVGAGLSDALHVTIQ